MGKLIRLTAFQLLAVVAAASAVRPATFQGRRDYPASGRVTVGDINGDGIPDIASISGDQVGILLGSLGVAFGKGDGTFEGQLLYGLGNGGCGQIILSNLHGQPPSAGLPDIVAPNVNSGVWVLINTTQR